MSALGDSIMFSSSGEELKQCRVCRYVKLATAFDDNQVSCKKCQLKRIEYRKQTTAKMRETSNKYHRNNKSKC